MGAFDIVFNYSGPAQFAAAFEAAAQRWEQIIIGDLPDVNSGTYGLIDDLLIDARIIAIDGQGGVLGRAGPDEFHPGSLLPYHGIMEFDTADIQNMFNNGTLTDVIIHEMGHVLGLGTLWDTFNLRSGANYTGANALREYRNLIGNNSVTGVPLETTGGSGTAFVHWSEAVFDRELMTGFAEASGSMPISRVTVGALQDLGYVVDYSAADAFSLGVPVITSNGSGDTATIALAENKWFVTTVVATDVIPVTYAIIGGADAARFTINAQTGVLSFIRRPDFEAPTDSDGNNSYIVQISASNGSAADAQTLTINVVNVNEPGNHPSLVRDFDRDGDSDLFAQHPTGLLRIYSMENGQVIFATDLGLVGSEWRVAGVADFDRDGDCDFILRDDNTGSFQFYRIQNGQIVSSISLGAVGLDFQVVTAGDFDRDGDGDLLLRHTDGTFRIYSIENGAVSSVSTLGAVGNEFRFLGVGDFDGDKDSDFFLQHQDGRLFCYVVENRQVVSAANLGAVGSEFRFLDTGDFDRDGDSDFLLRHDDGRIFSYSMQNNQVVGAFAIGLVGNENVFEVSGDFDGDLDGDMILRRGDGLMTNYALENHGVEYTLNLGGLGVEWNLL